MNNISGNAYNSRLNAWRGVAILWIVAAHLFSLIATNYFSSPENILYSILLYSLAVPLYMFFLLSGYFLTGRIFREEQDFDLSGFARKRIAKIAPHYFLAIILVLLVNTVSHPLNTQRRVILPEKAHATIVELNRHYDPANDSYYYIVAYQHETKGLLSFKEPIEGQRLGDIRTTYGRVEDVSYSLHFSNSSILPYMVFGQIYLHPDETVRPIEHTWFISVIMHYYLFFAVSAYALGRFFPSPRKKGMAYLVLVALIVFAFTAAFGLEANILYAVYMLALGTLLRYLERMGAPVDRLMGNPSALKKISMAAFLASIAMMAVLTASSPAFRSSLTLNTRVFHLILPVLFFIATLSEKGLPSLMIDNRITGFLGKFSYGIYIWHLPLIYLITTLASGYPQNSWILAAMCLVIAIILPVMIETLAFHAAGRIFKSRPPRI